MANPKTPAGATVIREEASNEAGDKLKEIKKSNTMKNFIETMEKKEKENLKPLSSDLEVIEDIDGKTLKEMQENKRLYGYDPKTKTAVVLKLAFAEKKEENKKKKEE